MNTVNTPQGEIKLLQPSVELLRAIRSFLPFGAYRIHPPENGADFGLVMQCGEREVYCVKQQPVSCDEEQGYVMFQANSILIAHCIADYHRNGFSGLFMPCAYIREKEAGQVESGIAYIGVPSSRGRETQDFPFGAWDDDFGHGFTTMMTSFIRSLQQSSRDTNIPLFDPIGLDVRPRSHLGMLSFGFLLVGPHIICIKTQINEQDPVWAALRSTGVSEVFHVPSVPAVIDESQLHITKPNV